MATVTFDKVTKRYTADTAAVKELSLEIRDKEFMVLVGPSGCGKSTALRMLAGLEDISEGQIRIGDRVINDLPSRSRDIAMVFQSYALYPHMTVFDNLAYPLKMRKTPRAEIQKRVNEAARILGIEAFLQRRPKALSGGQRQRVALGRAIVRDPQVFLLDEPLSNLDAKLRVQTRIELQKLHRDLGTTFIYVTHDQVEAMTMGDRIALMRDGVLQQVATPDDLYDRPANMYVAGFIGSPGMNFIPATVTDGSQAQASGFEITLPRKVPAQRVVLGIRPEALVQGEGGKDGGAGRAPLEMKVDVVERLGSDQYIYGQAGEDAITARVDPHFKVAVGDKVKLTVDPAAVHAFDAATEQRIAS